MDEAIQTPGLVEYDAAGTACIVDGAVAEGLGVALYGGHRGSEVVRHGQQELALKAP